MNAQAKHSAECCCVQCEGARRVDPAGLDKLILAAGKGVTRYLETLTAQKLGRPVNFWDGPDGLGAVLAEHIAAAGVPNKRLPELLTPRLVLEKAIPRKRRVRRVKA